MFERNRPTPTWEVFLLKIIPEHDENSRVGNALIDTSWKHVQKAEFRDMLKIVTDQWIIASECFEAPIKAS